LLELRTDIWGKEAIAREQFKGVVKLGFSWCGCDVLPFQGVDSLMTNLSKLLANSSERTVCLVQEMVPGVVSEHRVVCFHDKASGEFRKEAMWMENMKPHTSPEKYHLDSLDVRDFKVAGSKVVPSSAVAQRCFNGDSAALFAAEDAAQSLADRWLAWFEAEGHAPPQCTRLDFLVAHTGEGQAAVWTCEVGECGASLCSVEVHGRNLAALNSAIADDPSGRFPMSLPKTMPRNTGFKS